MKVSLTVSERITLASSVLPSENNFSTLKIVRKVKDQIGFSEEELKAYDLKTQTFENGQTRFTWDTTKEQSREFEFGEKTAEVITQSLKAISESKKATEQHLSLWEKFTQGQELFINQ